MRGKLCANVFTDNRIGECTGVNVFGMGLNPVLTLGGRFITAWLLRGELWDKTVGSRREMG